MRPWCVITCVAAGLFVLAAGDPAAAQDSGTIESRVEQNAFDVEEIVVTGTRTPERKLEASTAITTLNAVEIEARAPRSTADLIKVVPGFYVESSGGEVGGNLFARGLPADGSYRYVMLMEDGMPVYDSTELPFVNADIFVRIDENVARLEAVRGGNAALFGSNAPGGVINFLSRTGGPELNGTFAAMIGTDLINRYGLNLNGPIGDEWRFSAGGFYRYDDGVRDPGFAASKGGQFKGNITRLFDNGHVRLYAKYLDDRNVFYLPLPIRGTFDSRGKLTDTGFVPGFPSDGTLTSEEGVDARVPLPGGAGPLTLPLDDGQKQVGGMAMVEAAFTFGDGWEVQDKLRYMNVDHSWNAMLPSDLRDADDWAQRFVADTPGGASYRLTCTNVDDGGAPAVFGSAACPTANGLVNLGGQWSVEKPM